MNEKNRSVLDNIKMYYDQLFAAERKTVDYILDNPQEAIMLNITELAQKSGTSEATVVRTCKHLGYQGYYQMRLIMSHDLGKKGASYVDSEVIDTSKRFFDSSAAKVAALGEYIDIEELIEAVKILQASRMVHVIAAGNTSPIGMDLGFRLERCKIACTYSLLPEHFLNHVSLGKAEDSIIAISRSGASKQVVQAVELARKNHMRTIVITGNKQSQMAEYADCVLQVVDKEKKSPVEQEPDSHLSEMAINDAIIYCIRHFDMLMKTNEKNEERKNDCDEVELLLSEYKL